jgi:plastocyanin
VRSELGRRLVRPALIPLGAAAFIGALVYAVSRILLAVTKEGSVVVAILMAGAILFAAGAVARGGVLKDVQRVGLVVFAVLLFGSGIAVNATLGPREVETHAAAATITARNIAFDAKELRLPAGKPFAFDFVNADAGIPHNVAIYRSPTDLAAPLFKGEIFPGPATRRYQVESGLPAGLWYFQCDVHPQQMNGTVVAGEAGAAAPGPLAPGATASPGAAASPGGPASPRAAPPGGPAAPTVVSVTARNLAFEPASFTLSAGAPAAIEFQNQDPLPHNIAIYRDSSASENLFRGEIFSGPATRRYTFTAPPPGTYFFRCDVHPTMTGTVTVR